MSHPAQSDEADGRYRPLEGLDRWAAVAVDRERWDDAGHRIARLACHDPERGAMVADHGARLAAAHGSAAVDDQPVGGPGVGAALLAGIRPPPGLPAGGAAHVRANAVALGLAAGWPGPVTADLVLRLHEVACRPQPFHPVRVGGRDQHHVLAHGELKHHPNHEALGDGRWRAHAPVAAVASETGMLVATLGSAGFGALHPAAAAAYVLHAIEHVAPFADGNGRVARALAGGLVLNATGLPLVVADPSAYRAALDTDPAEAAPALVALVVALHAGLAGRVATAGDDAALARWRGEERSAAALGSALPQAVEEALCRHRAEPHRGWLPDLAGARPLAPRRGPGGETVVVVRAPAPDGTAVEEDLAVEAHPLGGGPVSISAEHHGSRLAVALAADDDDPALPELLGPWLDRVVATLALRVAAGEG